MMSRSPTPLGLKRIETRPDAGELIWGRKLKRLRPNRKRKKKTAPKACDRKNEREIRGGAEAREPGWERQPASRNATSFPSALNNLHLGRESFDSMKGAKVPEKGSGETRSERGPDGEGRVKIACM